MKITAIRPVVVHAGDRNWIFVRVETDQAGLYGWGEATLEWKTRAVVGSYEVIGPHVSSGESAGMSCNKNSPAPRIIVDGRRK